MIWSSVDQFDDMKFEFYTVLKEITSTVEPSVLYFFIKKISKVFRNLGDARRILREMKLLRFVC